MVNHEATLLAMIINDDNLWWLSGMKSEFFLQPQEKSVFRAMESAIREQGYLSREVVMSHCERSEYVDRVLREGAENIVTKGNWEFHRKEIVKAWKRQAISYAYLEAKTEAEESKDPDSTIDFLINELQNIRTEHVQDASVSYQERARRVLDILEERYHLEGLPGLSVGIPAIDGATGGLQPRRLYYVGARPSQGKSALLGQIAGELVSSGITVGYISLESSAEEVIIRDWSRTRKIPMHAMASGFLKQSQFADLDKEMQTAKDKGYWIDDTPNSDIGHIKRQAQIWKARFDIKALFVDYAQLIRVPGTSDRRETVEEASRTLKDISRHLNIPVVAAAQLRREADDRAPHLGDFQHSSALEQDADVCILLHWQEKMGEEIPVDAIIAKNRDGEKMSVPLTFTGRYMSFAQKEVVDVDS